MKRIRDTILNCIYKHAGDDDGLIDALQTITKTNGRQAFSVFFNVLTHLELDPDTAENCWHAVLEHRKKLIQMVGREINLRTVICDYFCSVDRTLKNPVFVEIHVFQDHLNSLKYDGLTRLLTRNMFEETFKREFSRAKRYKTDLSVLFLDLDDFKNINDTFGHIAGDTVLKDVGRIIRSEIRAEDSAARYGGEEFVIILPQTGKAEALILSERIRKKVASLNLEYEDKYIQPTVSGGLACFPMDARTEKDLLNFADQALYRAKEFGKNNIAVYSPNKRRYARIGSNGDIRIREIGGSEGFPSFLTNYKNISMAGVLFESKFPLELGTRVELTLSTDHKASTFTLIGTVVRVEVFDPTHYDIGVSFLDLGESVKNEISEYILHQIACNKN